ncbi:MAG: hypothetical protein AB1Z98_22030 [Nannocystaceae bacterium]
MTVLCGLAAQSSHAAGVCQAQLVPVAVLVGNPDSTGYIQPNCSKCKKLKVETQTTATGGLLGVLTLIFHDAQQRDFVGTIELTMVLFDDSEHTLVLEDVELAEGEEVAWAIDENANQWTWDQVEMVRMEMAAG